MRKVAHKIIPPRRRVPASIRGILSLEILHASKRKLQARLIRNGSLAIIGIVLFLQSALVTFNFLTPERPVLGMRLENRSLSTWSGEASQQRAGILIEEHESQPITVFHGDHSEVVTFRELGEQADIDKVYEKVLQVGRSGTLLTKIIEQNQAALGLHNGHFARQTINEEQALARMESIEKSVKLEPVAATFVSIDDTVTITPHRNGHSLDAAASLASVLKADTSRSPRVALSTTPVETIITENALKKLLPQAESISAEPVTVKAADHEVTISKEQIVESIVVEEREGRIELTMNDERLKTYIAELVSKVSIPASPTYMIGAKVTREGSQGSRIKDDNPAALIADLLRSRQTDASDKPHILTFEITTVSPTVVQQEIANNSTGTAMVRLTFDDGPGGYTDKVLDILKGSGIHATFYLVGREVPKNPQIAKRIVAEGHIVGNHTYNHPELTRLSLAAVRDEISRTQAVILEHTGVTPVAFRPPYGAHNPEIRNIAAELGMSNDLWSIDSEDWKRSNANDLAAHTLKNVQPGSVILLHSIHPQIVDALPIIIKGIRDRGLTIE